MRLQTLDDAHLVTRAKAGSVDAFEELVHRHRDRAFRVALRMVGDRGEAEDITQDALVAAWRSLDGFRADSAFTTWLHRIVLNRCLNALRARRETEPLPDDRASARPSTERTVEARIKLEDVRQAILQLTPEQRGPLVLRELEDCSYDELAESLDVSVSAVKSRLHRARLELLNAVRGWQ
ncbi:sigma-70 family RNA polymerase sigma factor [soil metagenome]